MRIEQTYCGPPDSAHGGVAVGRFAELVGGGPTEVRLIGPPPLDTEMESRTEEDGVIVVSGPGGDLARVRSLPEPVLVDPFSLVTESDLESAAAAYLRRVDEDGHPFPTCFGCGPERGEGDGLRQFAGPVPGGDRVAARFRVDGDGLLPSWMVWAGLDCPSGFAVTLDENPPSTFVLGTMSGQVQDEVRAGVDYQVQGRLVAADGRKLTTEVAMLAPDGTTVGAARAVWIAMDPSQF
jgi:hypothetical protein